MIKMWKMRKMRKMRKMCKMRKCEKYENDYVTMWNVKNMKIWICEKVTMWKYDC